jgi:erythromycin esterase-like protein
VAVEADWPDAYRVNRYVRGRSDDATAEESLRGFERFPTWMWRNAVVLDFVGWLRELFHEVGEKSFLVPLARDGQVGDTLRSPHLERAIGVIYRPDTERQSHYFRARLADQFDAVIHIDETRAVEPLERTARWEEGEVPETYPHAV